MSLLKIFKKQLSPLKEFEKKAREHYLTRYQKLLDMVFSEYMPLEDANFYLENEPDIIATLEDQKKKLHNNLIEEQYLQIVKPEKPFAEQYLEVTQDYLELLNEQLKIVNNIKAITPLEVKRKNRELAKITKTISQTEETIAGLKSILTKISNPVGRPRKNPKKDENTPKRPRGRPKKQITNEEVNVDESEKNSA